MKPGYMAGTESLAEHVWVGCKVYINTCIFYDDMAFFLTLLFFRIANFKYRYELKVFISIVKLLSIFASHLSIEDRWPTHFFSAIYKYFNFSFA